MTNKETMLKILRDVISKKVTKETLDLAKSLADFGQYDMPEFVQMLRGGNPELLGVLGEGAFNSLVSEIESESVAHGAAEPEIWHSNLEALKKSFEEYQGNNQ